MRSLIYCWFRFILLLPPWKVYKFIFFLYKYHLINALLRERAKVYEMVGIKMKSCSLGITLTGGLLHRILYYFGTHMVKVKTNLWFDIPKAQYNDFIWMTDRG